MNNNEVLQNEIVVGNQLVLENENLKVIINPGLGGKITALICKRSRVQFLSQSDVPAGSIKQQKYGSVYGPPFACGFDECFPTVSPCTIQFNDKPVDLPDHGELWTQPWEYELADGKVTMTARGKKLNYRFTKKIWLDGCVLQSDYEIENTDSGPFHYIWSSHPLLEIDEGDQILLGGQVKEVVLNWASSPDLGAYGETLGWPYLNKLEPDKNYAFVQRLSDSMAIKVFAKELQNGTVGLYRHRSDKTLLFHFDTKVTPYLGIWLCYGGWPAGAKSNEYTVALEPASGCPDTLSDAISRNAALLLNPGQTARWSLAMEVSDGKYSVD